MSTLRGFVHAVWESDETLFDKGHPDATDGKERQSNPVWAKPDERYVNYELRRITTERAKNRCRCDFYELYWADLMQGTTWDHVSTWICNLLFRRPEKVPPRLKSAWIFLWGASIAALALLILSILPSTTNQDAATNWSWGTYVRTGGAFVASLVLTALINLVFLRYVGDAARYLGASPANVQARQEIRQRGIDLLERLMGISEHGITDPREREYDRIIVVGHSLGAVVGYDILKHTFARVHDQFEQSEMAEQPRRHELEELIRGNAEKDEKLNIGAYQNAQDAARHELIECGSPWIVSDFVTIGSPLGHAEVLLAQDRKDLHAQQRERNLPTCPPELELDLKTKLKHFSYWPGDRRKKNEPDSEALLTRIPHFASHFAFTKWTNIYSPSRAIFWGDVISAPVAETFASKTDGRSKTGIRDEAVMVPDKIGDWPLTHTKYWNMTKDEGADVPHHISVLRKAINFLEENEK